MRGRVLPVLLVLAMVASAGLAGATTFPTAGSALTAETTWGAKQAVDLDKFTVLGRSPWLEEPSGEGVTVAIIDTGIDTSHPDLRSKDVLFQDLVGDASGTQRTSPYDDNGHGTHVAGILAGHGHRKTDPTGPYWLTGTRGIAPDADLVVAKAMDGEGRGEDAKVAKAVRWAMDPDGDGDLEDGADVINLSLGITRQRSEPTDVAAAEVGSRTRGAIEDAVTRGIVVVVSSGNQGAAAVSDPGDLDPVITVGATDRNGAVAGFSNHGRYLDVLAPGVLVSTYPVDLDTRDGRQDGYVGMAGTSMAAPVVAGVVALAMDAQPRLLAKSTTEDMSWKAAYVQDLVRGYATPPTGDDAAPERGSHGVVNAYATLLAVDEGTQQLDPVQALVFALVTLGLARLGVGVVRWVGGLGRGTPARGASGGGGTGR